MDWQLAIILTVTFGLFVYAAWDFIVYPFIIWGEDDE